MLDAAAVHPEGCSAFQKYAASAIAAKVCEDIAAIQRKGTRSSIDGAALNAA